jgi:hypothetical protein
MLPNTANCCICQHPVSTANVPSKDALSYCGDCGRPTCGDHREDTGAERCSDCAAKNNAKSTPSPYYMVVYFAPGIGTPEWFDSLGDLQKCIASCLETDTPFKVGHEFRSTLRQPR